MRCPARFVTVTNTVLVALLTRGAALADADPDQAQLAGEARGLVREFVDQLKPALQQALAEGGPTHAIEVCASRAPMIADSLSATSGWSLHRVSLRVRNTSRAQPDNWERAVLEDFDRRAASGENPAGISYSEMLPGRFRYMQAQGVEPVCLLCHGENLGPDVRATLADFYPDDSATGYSLGQLRGAISLTRTLD